jgi:hypothetical protein
MSNNLIEEKRSLIGSLYNRYRLSDSIDRMKKYQDEQGITKLAASLREGDYVRAEFIDEDRPFHTYIVEAQVWSEYREKMMVGKERITHTIPGYKGSRLCVCVRIELFALEVLKKGEGTE